MPKPLPPEVQAAAEMLRREGWTVLPPGHAAAKPSKAAGGKPKSPLGGVAPAMDLDQLRELLKDAETFSGLTDWEEEFLQSTRERFEQYGERIRLSPGQIGVIGRIQEKIYAE